MRIAHLIRAALLPFLTAAAAPVAAAAQQTADRSARADALFEQASQLEQASTGEFDRHVRSVARLYLRSAALRPIDDPMRIESLNRAGKLLFAIDPGRAHAVLAKAADLALMHGDAATSAHAYLDAAAAIERDARASSADRRAANEYVTMALRLADIPVLTDAQRNRILRRIDSSSSLAML